MILHIPLEMFGNCTKFKLKEDARDYKTFQIYTLMHMGCSIARIRGSKLNSIFYT